MHSKSLISGIIRHIGIRHAHERNFSIAGEIDECRKFFAVYPSFRRHVYRNHHNVIVPDGPDSTFVHRSDCADDELNANVNSPDSATGHASSDATEAVCTESDIVKNLGMFCLKLK